jgi:hypothetical protein
VRGEFRGKVPRRVVVRGIVTGLSAVETASFSDTLSAFRGSEFGQSDSVNIHGIWFSVVPGIGRERRGRSLSPFQG